MLQSTVQSDVQKVRSIKVTLCLLLSASHRALMVYPHIRAWRHNQPSLCMLLCGQTIKAQWETTKYKSHFLNTGLQSFIIPAPFPAPDKSPRKSLISHVVQRAMQILILPENRTKRTDSLLLINQRHTWFSLIIIIIRRRRRRTSEHVIGKNSERENNRRTTYQTPNRQRIQPISKDKLTKTRR